MAHAMQRISGNVLVRGVPGGMGEPRAGRARASSAPPRARAARRSQNPSPAPRRWSSFRFGFVGDGGGEGGALCVNGGPMRGRSGRILYRRRPLAHANRPRRVYAMRCALATPSCPVVSDPSFLPALWHRVRTPWIGPTGFPVLRQAVVMGFGPVAACLCTSVKFAAHTLVWWAWPQDASIIFPQKKNCAATGKRTKNKLICLLKRK